MQYENFFNNENEFSHSTNDVPCTFNYETRYYTFCAIKEPFSRRIIETLIGGRVNFFRSLMFAGVLAVSENNQIHSTRPGFCIIKWHLAIQILQGMEQFIFHALLMDGHFK